MGRGASMNNDTSGASWVQKGEHFDLMDGGELIAQVWPRRDNYSKATDGSYRWHVFRDAKSGDRYGVRDTSALAMGAAEAALFFGDPE